MKRHLLYALILGIALGSAATSCHAKASPELQALRAEYKALKEKADAEREAKQIAELKAKIRKLKHPLSTTTLKEST